MLDRFEKPLRIICLVLAAVMLFQVAWVVFRKNPLKGLVVPPLPTLPASMLATSNALMQGMEKKGTNVVEKVGGGGNATNETNGVSPNKKSQTNSVIGAGETNVPLVSKTAEKKTNSVADAVKEGTNSVALKESEKKETNSLPKMSMPGMSSFPGMGGGKKPINLPPDIQARVDKITSSEILAPVMKPLPMALLGIAGNSAFLRSANGQTGVVKEGDEIGGLKLLKIGVNRVLVEQDGEKKELMVFSGFGGESLLPKEKEQKQTNETTKKL